MQHLIEELQPFMLTNQYRQTTSKVLRCPSNKFYSVNEKDSLFWTLYICVYGFNAYEQHLPVIFSREKEQKYLFLDLLRDPYNKTMLKVNQIKNTKNEIENNIANDDKITIKTFIALAILSKLNFLFVEKSKIYSHAEVVDSSTFIIHKKDDVCCIDTEVDVEETLRMMKTCFIWENIEKPIKSITSYKREELLELSIKLGIEVKDKAPTKKELYEYVCTLI
jgi:hypothetical protein